jgi:hypothetical protein
MLVSDMQRAIGEEIFAIPEFANWASKIADTLFNKLHIVSQSHLELKRTRHSQSHPNLANLPSAQ